MRHMGLLVAMANSGVGVAGALVEKRAGLGFWDLLGEAKAEVQGKVGSPSRDW